MNKFCLQSQDSFRLRLGAHDFFGSGLRDLDKDPCWGALVRGSQLMAHRRGRGGLRLIGWGMACDAFATFDNARF